MSKIRLLLVTTCLACNLAFGHEREEHREKIGGVPLADFQVNELRIPCVEVQNIDPSVDGQFFDVILERRGNSMNFELKFFQTEDPDFCRTAADFSKFHDHDFNDDPGDTKIQVLCERRQNRSKVSVNAKNLLAGQYRAEIHSDGNSASSPFENTVDDEVEFDFDSDPDDIAEGATAIAPDFIQETVSAKIVDAAGQTVLAVNDAACLIVC